MKNTVFCTVHLTHHRIPQPVSPAFKREQKLRFFTVLQTPYFSGIFYRKKAVFFSRFLLSA
jgi:hypothetical protein